MVYQIFLPSRDEHELQHPNFPALPPSTASEWAPTGGGGGTKLWNTCLAVHPTSSSCPSPLPSWPSSVQITTVVSLVPHYLCSGSSEVKLSLFILVTFSSAKKVDIKILVSLVEIALSAGYASADLPFLTQVIPGCQYYYTFVTFWRCHSECPSTFRQIVWMFEYFQLKVGGKPSSSGLEHNCVQQDPSEIICSNSPFTAAGSLWSCKTAMT